jgi:hypothetical protein
LSCRRSKTVYFLRGRSMREDWGMAFNNQPSFLRPCSCIRPARSEYSAAMSDPSRPHDPFREARRKDGVLPCEFQGERMPMILRHEDVRRAARDWKTFSSDAPFRVPIPSEENVRSLPRGPVE